MTTDATAILTLCTSCDTTYNMTGFILTFMAIFINAEEVFIVTCWSDVWYIHQKLECCGWVYQTLVCIFYLKDCKRNKIKYLICEKMLFQKAVNIKPEHTHKTQQNILLTDLILYWSRWCQLPLLLPRWGCCPAERWQLFGANMGHTLHYQHSQNKQQ